MNVPLPYSLEKISRQLLIMMETFYFSDAKCLICPTLTLPAQLIYTKQGEPLVYCNTHTQEELYEAWKKWVPSTRTLAVIKKEQK